MVEPTQVWTTTSIPHRGISPSLSAPVSWRLTVEAVALTELCANLASGLTMVTSVTMELSIDFGLTAATSVTAELATGIGKEERKFTFADK